MLASEIGFVKLNMLITLKELLKLVVGHGGCKVVDCKIGNSHRTMKQDGQEIYRWGKCNKTEIRILLETHTINYFAIHTSP
jgi:hypothetical protein